MAAFGYDRPTFLEDDAAVLSAPAAAAAAAHDDSGTADAKLHKQQVAKPMPLPKSPHTTKTKSSQAGSGAIHAGSDTQTSDGAHVISAAASPLAQPPATVAAQSASVEEASPGLLQATGVSASQLFFPDEPTVAPAAGPPAWQVAGATGFVLASGRPVTLFTARAPRSHSAPRPATWGSQKENEPGADAPVDGVAAAAPGTTTTTWLAIEGDHHSMPSHGDIAVERAMRPVFSGFTTAAGRMVFATATAATRKHAMPAASCPTSPTARDLAVAEAMLSGLAVGRPAERGKRSRSRSSGAVPSPPLAQPTRGQPRGN